MTPVTDPSILAQLNKPTPVMDTAILAQLNAPNISSSDDSQASFAGGLERGAAGTAMLLPDMLNQAVAGPQMLYRGVTGREHDDSPMWQPFYSSEDVLQALPPELRPHDPQTTAGKLAGIMGGLTGGVATMAGGKILNDAADPFYKLGKNKIISDLMMSKAENPVQAANAIQNAPEYVKGSIPVAGVASGDVGLMGLQRGAENLPASEQMFKDRAIQQTAAQNDALGDVAGNAADLGKMLSDRSTATRPFYEAATNAPYNPHMLKPVLDNIDEQISKVGTTTQAGKMLSDMRANIIAESDNPSKMGPLIQMYKENRDNFAKKMLQDGAVTPAVKGVVNPANKALGDALTRANPDIAQADATYAQMSVPINQLEAGQAIKGQIQANSPNASGQLPIVQPKLQQMMENGVVNVDGKEIPISDLSPSQQKGLAGLQNDLNRNTQATGSRVAATPASELNNLATKSPIMGLASHIPWIKGAVTSQNQKLQQEIARVMLDNPRAAELLKGAPMLLGNKLPTNQALAQMLIQGGINGAGLHQKGSQ